MRPQHKDPLEGRVPGQLLRGWGVWGWKLGPLPQPHEAKRVFSKFMLEAKEDKRRRGGLVGALCSTLLRKMDKTGLCSLRLKKSIYREMGRGRCGSAWFFLCFSSSMSFGGVCVATGMWAVCRLKFFFVYHLIVWWGGCMR